VQEYQGQKQRFADELSAQITLANNLLSFLNTRDNAACNPSSRAKCAHIGKCTTSAAAVSLEAVTAWANSRCRKAQTAEEKS